MQDQRILPWKTVSLPRFSDISQRKLDGYQIRKVRWVLLTHNSFTVQPERNLYFSNHSRESLFIHADIFFLSVIVTRIGDVVQDRTNEREPSAPPPSPRIDNIKYSALFRESNSWLRAKSVDSILADLSENANHDVPKTSTLRNRRIKKRKVSFKKFVMP